jgi:predicted O-methyltransferase YrrM
MPGARKLPRRVIALAAFLAAGAIASGLLLYLGAAALAFGVGIVTLGASLTFSAFLAERRLRSELLAAASEAREDRYRLAAATALEIRCSTVIARRFPEISMPQTGFSMISSNLVGLLDLLDASKPKTVVELGSGFSTLLIAAWLKQEGEGRLISFDHQSLWAEKCRTYLRRQELDGRAEVREAALGRRRIAEESFNWYELDGRIEDVAEIDLLIVDGPPSQPGKRTRFPALAFFHDRLSKSASIFVDDGNRSGERAMVEAWTREFPGFFSYYTSTLTGYWVLRRSPREQAEIESMAASGARGSETR